MDYDPVGLKEYIKPRTISLTGVHWVTERIDPANEIQEDYIGLSHPSGDSDLDNDVGENHVGLQVEKEAYIEQAYRQAEEHHRSPSYAPLLTCHPNCMAGRRRK